MEKTDFRHSVPVQIRFNDIDIAGHVNNAVHLYYYDYGRMHYFNQVFRDTINWKVNGLVLVNINVDFLLPIYLEEKIVTDTRIIRIGKKSLEMIQQIRPENDPDAVKSRNKSILVGYHYRDNYSFELPDEWVSCIREFDKDVEIRR